ncbi:MAG: hypothetical protein JSS72_11545 [Armatimonadetes bacterium]|nr:hypothetical protein [Armatimonadota bacterium]
MIEILVGSAAAAMIMTGLIRVTLVGLDYNQRAVTRQSSWDKQIEFESTVRRLIQRARVTDSTTDTFTYFIASNQSGGLSSSGADTIVLTAQGDAPPSYVLNSTDDFETINRKYGPQGGTEEIGLSTTAVGDAGGKTGLFLRRQRPGDATSTSGGYEELLDSDVHDVTFEFWDGTQWAQSWDTTTGQRRLPAAVRMTYTLNGEDTSRILTVQLPLSDVTSSNPLSQTSTTTTGGATR